jgi:hypothetical protein
MKRQRIKLRDYGWLVYVYYNVTSYDIAEVYDALIGIGCDGFDLEDAWENLNSKEPNRGLTYSNFRNRESVIVISPTTSAEQFAKTWRHELGHLATHIASAFKLNLEGEEIQYIGDKIVGETWSIAKDMLCECS